MQRNNSFIYIFQKDEDCFAFSEEAKKTSFSHVSDASSTSWALAG